MPDKLDMTETTITIPRYIKEGIKALTSQKAQTAGRYVSQKEYLSDLINRELKKSQKHQA